MAKYTIPANQQQAIATAIRLAGLEPVHAQRARAAIADLRGDSTPFVRLRVVELQRAWTVRIDGVRWTLPSSIPRYLDHYERTVSIWLAHTTGQLLRIEAEADVEDAHMRPVPTGSLAEAHLSRSRERFAGLPEEEPVITFVGALDRILSGGLGSPFAAKAVHALYVLHTKFDSRVRPVWSITLRGLPPIEVSVPPGVNPAAVPVWQRNHSRNVVDAVTGKVLYATTVPQPVETPTS